MSRNDQRPHLATRPRRRSDRRDRGAVLIETAIIAPLLFALIFGVLEVGGALKSYSSASNAVRSGSRMGSVQGNDLSADLEVLARMARESKGMGKGEINYVIIWKAVGTGDKPPQACIDAAESGGSIPNIGSLGVAGTCNVYVRPDATGGAFDMATGKAGNAAVFYFGCTSAVTANKVDCRWRPDMRNVVISPRGTSTGALRPDTIGVHINATHNYYTGMFGKELTVTDNSVALLEPDSFGVAPAN